VLINIAHKKIFFTAIFETLFLSYKLYLSDECSRASCFVFPTQQVV